MNIKALIKKYEAVECVVGIVSGKTILKTVLKDLKQLDEPEKVKVPQFVAEKIEYFKKTGDWDLFQAMDYLFEKKEIREWLEDKNNQETFARAWLDGYEVEKEKKYIVTLKSSGQKLYYHTEDEDYIFSSYDGVFYSGYHTKTDLEENGMSWVFDCEGLEVQEVE